ncbi:MAG TPA: M1 family metallopeptidase [Syntrophomonadaceae bacterium]|nr:M1 family metallopeptidase [Syntrophomonadaceae bacterium]
MNTLKGKKLFFLILIISIIGIGYPLYKGPADGEEKSALARTEVETEMDNLFPSPSKTLYQMGLYLDTNHDLLYGSTLLNTENTSPKTLGELWFTVYPNAFKDAATSPIPESAYYAGFDEGWFEFSEIIVNGTELSHEIEGISARVNLETEILAGESLEIEMKWKAKIPKAAYRYGRQNNVYMLGNFYPTLNVMGEDWHKSYNSKFGDPFCFHSANYLVRLNTPEVYDVAATGSNIQKYAEDNGRQTHIIEARDVRDFSLAVLHDYAQINEKLGQTEVKLYAPRNKINKAKPLLGNAVEMLNYYACRFGSYPYKEFKIVFVPMQGFQGMEYSGLIFMRDEFSRPNYNQRQNKFILAHEIAHQWWYGMVGNDQIKEPWLDEGLANWSASKYLQEVKGQNSSSDFKLRKGTNLALELKDFSSTAKYYEVIYSGGEAFWFDLENKLGTEEVFRILRKYLLEYKHNIANTEDLLNLIQDETKQDMGEFFNQWFESP